MNEGNRIARDRCASYFSAQQPAASNWVLCKQIMEFLVFVEGRPLARLERTNFLNPLYRTGLIWLPIADTACVPEFTQALLKTLIEGGSVNQHLRLKLQLDRFRSCKQQKERRT